MDTHWFNKLLDLLNVQTNSENEKLMVLYLDKELRKLKLDYVIDAAGNILVTKGKTNMYPCVVSHMDTVHSFVSNFTIYTDKNDKNKLFAMSNKQRAGIGGDDKCGIFACLYMLKTIPQIKVVFFSREERGCAGSRAIDKGFFADCMYLIQLDRKGKGDFIQTCWGNKTISHDFSSGIGLLKKEYNYKNATGTTTDVFQLWNNKVGISCINLSCGYYSPHTIYEHISISNLWHSVKFTEKIIDTMKSKRYVSLPPKPTVIITPYISKHNQCCKCKVWKIDALLYKVEESKTGEMICYRCKYKVKDNSKSDNKNDSKNNGKNKMIITFACHECGLTTTQLTPGDSLKYRGDGKHLYCDGCASIFFASDKNLPTVCGLCNEEIPDAHYRTTIEGVLVCGICACDWRGCLSDDCKCWVCSTVISKDAEIIHRFGHRICEDCACISDTRTN